MNQDFLKSFLDKNNVYAVIGVSDNPSKYGHVVFFDLLNAGYKTYGVNPRGGEVRGEKIYPSLDDLPEAPDVVNLVVPPSVTVKVLEKCVKLGVKKAWMQPGAESPEAIQFCRDNGIDVIHDMCIMVQKNAF